MKESKKPCNKCFLYGLPVAVESCCRKQVAGQIALINGDNLKQIIEKLLGIIQMILYKLQECKCNGSR
jgi:hypothetical protein